MWLCDTSATQKECSTARVRECVKTPPAFTAALKTRCNSGSMLSSYPHTNWLPDDRDSHTVSHTHRRVVCMYKHFDCVFFKRCFY